MNKTGIIIGSVRENRRSIKVGQWVNNELKDETGLFEIVDLAEYKLVHYNEPGSPSTSKGYKYEATTKWSETIKQYDSFIFVTPEYNGYFTGALKDAIDYLYHEWEGKSFIVVGYGGRGAKYAANHLVTLLKRFDMKHIGNVAILKPWDSLKSDGSIDPEFIEGSIKELSSKL